MSDTTIQREESHASEQRFHQLVDAVTDYAIFMLDASGRVATWNAGAQKNKGYDAHEIVGQHFSVFYTPEDRAAVVDVDPDIGATLADADRLQQIVWNLLTNAVRFTPRGGRVVSADRAASGIEIRVRDTGLGIAGEHLPVIFERFKQVDSSTTRAQGGLGLGLSIVRHLVEAHGGSVEAHSEGVGHGATFTVVLPVRAVSTAVSTGQPADTQAASTRAAEGKPDEQAGENAASLADVRVLVVDDDTDALEVLREVLEAVGAHVTTATSAREGFEAIDAGGAFEIIVSDIGMPDTDGYAFIRGIRSREMGGDVPAIALTAYARPADAELAMNAGYQQHLAKPVDARQLLQAVRALARVSAKQTNDRSASPRA